STTRSKANRSRSVAGRGTRGRRSGRRFSTTGDRVPSGDDALHLDVQRLIRANGHWLVLLAGVFAVVHRGAEARDPVGPRWQRHLVLSIFARTRLGVELGAVEVYGAAERSCSAGIRSPDHHELALDDACPV